MKFFIFSIIFLFSILEFGFAENISEKLICPFNNSGNSNLEETRNVLLSFQTTNELFDYLKENLNSHPNIVLSALDEECFNMNIQKNIAEIMKEATNIEYLGAYYMPLIEEHYQFVNLPEYTKEEKEVLLFHKENILVATGNSLSNIASRESMKEIILWTATKYITNNHLPYMQQWFSHALEKNPYETIIALRRALYKDKIEFWNPIAKDFLLDFYHKALKKY